MSKFLAVSLLALIAVANASHDFSGPNTVELTASNYESQVRV
jgi:hypothetical protein